MKLAKIREDLYLNPCNITSIEFDDEYNTTLITMVNGDVFSLKLPTKKVLDVVCGSKKSLDSSKLYKISVASSHSENTYHGTASRAFELLEKLRDDQTLTIKK